MRKKTKKTEEEHGTKTASLPRIADNTYKGRAGTIKIKMNLKQTNTSRGRGGTRHCMMRRRSGSRPEGEGEREREREREKEGGSEGGREGGREGEGGRVRASV